jgi:hypothetical protein
MTEHEQELRAWAKGLLTLEAGTELLIRGFEGRFARPGKPWIREGDEGNLWIDFESIPEWTGALSGGERRFLAFTASIASNTPVVLDDAIPGLDRRNVQLILAAIVHAAGLPQTLAPWPA